MTTLFCIFLVLCTLAVYSSCQQSLEPWRSGILIGEKCERDVECIDNAYCYWQQTCLCDPFYSSNPDKSLCLASAGLSCTDDTICQTMANGECQQGTCTCKDNFFLDSRNASNCISRPQIIGDPCQKHIQCQDSFNRSFCINNKCECATEHHFVNQTKNCVITKRLYTTCDFSYECYEPDKSPDSMECKDSQCVCKEGEPCAGKGSLTTVAGPLLMVSLLLSYGYNESLDSD